MKLLAIANAEGEILGTARVIPEKIEGDDPPNNVGLIPEIGQFIYEIEVPDKFADLPPEDLHTRFRVAVKPGKAELIEFKER